MSIHESVINLINQENLIPEGGRVMAALSGGSDSVALTLLLREISQTENFSLVGVVHLNHQLRSNSDADEKFCRDFAKKYGLTIEVKRVDVRRCAEAEHISLELQVVYSSEMPNCCQCCCRPRSSFQVSGRLLWPGCLCLLCSTNILSVGTSVSF